VKVRDGPHLVPIRSRNHVEPRDLEVAIGGIRESTRGSTIAGKPASGRRFSG
jgi:hypothetical protein